MFKKHSKLWKTLLILIALSPIGTMPKGTAFGGWGSKEVFGTSGHVPVGMVKVWHFAPLSEYKLPGLTNTFQQYTIGYMFSAAIGVGLIMLFFSILKKFMKD